MCFDINILNTFGSLEVGVLFSALLGGILPALLWLWFWLGEDRLHPEPRKLLFTSFLLGMAAVFIALPLERCTESFLKNATLVIIAWAAIEEILKFTAAYFGGLNKKECDEPLDPLIYLITAALGFSAAENCLFLISSVKESFVNGLITGNLRFIGASLLHILGSGIIGLFIARSFFKTKQQRIVSTIIGLTVAITIHSLFNYFIVRSQSSSTFVIFSVVWAAIILLLWAFEKVKKIRSNTQGS